VAPTPDFSALTSDAARGALESMLGAYGDSRRWDGYTVSEDAVRRAILRCYAADGHAPDAAWAHVTRLRVRDRVVLDGDGEAILGAYPFTGRATEHRVRLGARVLNAMCAVDALGVGAMVGRDTDSESRCRQCDAPIRVTTAGTGESLAALVPESVVVWIGIQYRDSCAATSLCTGIAFFCDDDHLRRWRASFCDDDHLRQWRAGHRLSAAEAFEVGKAIFRPMMRPPAAGD
jgi:mercuric reductase